jgi:tetratricopeptide (TPR) repeat protein
LLREHARVLAAADPAESDEAAGRLLDYYLHGALAAGRYFTPWASTYRRQPPPRPPGHVPDLSTLGQAGAWLEAERANLHAAVDYAADHGRAEHATAIPAAMSGFLSARGFLDRSAALHTTALTAARQAGDRFGEAGAIAEIGVLQQGTGDYKAAAVSLIQAATIFGDLGDMPGEAYALNQLGFVHVVTGDYPAAATTHRQAVALARAASDPLAEAIALVNLGLLQQLTGDHPAALAGLQRALSLCRELDILAGQAHALNCLGVVQQETGTTRPPPTARSRPWRCTATSETRSDWPTPSMT